MHRVVAVLYGVAGLWFLLLASPRSLGEAAVKYAFAAILLFCPASITLAGRRQLSWPVEARHDGFSLSSLTLVFCSAQTGRAPSVQSGGGSFPRSSRRWWSDAPVDRQPPASWPVLRTRDPSPRTADLR